MRPWRWIAVCAAIGGLPGCLIEGPVTFSTPPPYVVSAPSAPPMPPTEVRSVPVQVRLPDSAPPPVSIPRLDGPVSDPESPPTPMGPQPVPSSTSPRPRADRAGPRMAKED